MEAAWRQGITRRRCPRKTLFACAVNAQQISAASKDRFKRVGLCVPALFCRVRGAGGKEKGRLENLSSFVKLEAQVVALAGELRNELGLDA